MIPLFSSVEAALRFAFNASNSAAPKPPSMNAAMASVPAHTATQYQHSVRTLVSEGMQLGSLDRVAQAGLILAQVARLDAISQHILTARFMNPTQPCDCKRRCCSGHYYADAWRSAISTIETEFGTATGKSVDPVVRAETVKSWARGQRISMRKLGEIANVSQSTSARQITWIREWLAAEDGRAFVDIAQLFDQTGITGSTVFL